MVDPHSITPDALEILVNRELRKARIEPMRLRRRDFLTSGTAFTFDLVGLLSAYGHQWKVLVECRNRAEPMNKSDLDAVTARARSEEASSILVFTTSQIDSVALDYAADLRVAIMRVVDAQSALAQAGLIDGSQIPAWVPEFTAQLLWSENGQVHTRLITPDSPESILRLLRPRA